MSSRGAKNCGSHANIGLVVAIPATIAYNFLLSELGEVETELVNFAGAFLNRVEREVTWGHDARKDG